MDAIGAPAGAIDTFPKLLDRNAKEFGASPAYREKEFGIWQTENWVETRERVRAFAMGLMALGLQRQEHVAIIGTNRPALYRAIVAAQCIGGIPVPVYSDSVAEEMAFVLDHCGATFAVVEDQEQVDKLIEVSEQLPALRKIVYLDPRGLRKYDHTNMHAYSEVMELGRAEAGRLEAATDAIIAGTSGHDICVMLYTSGTTGRPKGVVLSNDNVIKTAAAAAGVDRLTRQDQVLAYLPIAWVGDFIFSLGQAYWTGFCVSCPERADTMRADLQEIGPSYFFAPPRIFESLLTSVMIRMEDAGPVKKWLFKHFMEIARRVGPALLDGRPVRLMDRLAYGLGDLLIYGPLKNSLGLLRIRVGYTAG
ncbi:MAG TPA: AMP-binding protein, partial [Paracoccaceae bacterium]|nr:AMP-binding protein [Paracoccaceae bacterium]